MYKDIHANKLSLKNIFYYNKQRKTYIELAVSLIIIVVFLIFALIPTIGTIDKVQESIKRYEEIKSTQQQILDQGRALNELSNETNGTLVQEIQYLNKIIPNQTDIRLIYVNIYNRAKRTNTVIKNIKINESNTRQSLSETNNLLSPVYITLELQIDNNTVNELNEFIKLIEGPNAFPFPSIITRINIQDPNEKMDDQDQQNNNTSNNSENTNTTEESNRQNIHTNLTMLLFFTDTINLTN